MEFYVCDIHLYPFYRIRRVTKLQTPYFENSIGEVITLIQVLISMRKMIEKSIEIIKSFLIGLKDIIIIDNDEYGDDENDDDDDIFIFLIDLVLIHKITVTCLMITELNFFIY